MATYTEGGESKLVLSLLALIDLVLVGSLMVMVMFSGMSWMRATWRTPS
jgi:uncharacterized membrane protein YqhA